MLGPAQSPDEGVPGHEAEGSADGRRRSIELEASGLRSGSLVVHHRQAPVTLLDQLVVRCLAAFIQVGVASPEVNTAEAGGLPCHPGVHALLSFRDEAEIFRRRHNIIRTVNPNDVHLS